MNKFLSRIKLAATACLLLAVGALAAGCGAASTAPSQDGILNTAFQADMPGGADPDTFYDVEGLKLTTNVYEGLLGYRSNSTEIEPRLAESYKASPDGKTYTFKLRDGVKFTDGTDFDSKAMKASLERRSALKGAPAYMLDDVDRIDTPDPRTLVVRLKQPNSAFLHHLAGPYSPKAISPTAVKKHDKGGDHAKEWLSSHSAGTGAYSIKEFNPGRNYVLERNPDYWDGKPAFKQVDIAILPDLATQQVKLRSGELDLLTAQLGANDVKVLKSSPSVEVETFTSAYKENVFLNPNRGVFQDPEMRQAFLAGIDRDQIVKSAMGPMGRKTDDLFPVGAMPTGEAALDIPLDASALQRAASALPPDQRKVDIGYMQGTGGVSARVAGFLQQQLEKVGLKPTVRGVDLAQSYELPTRPNLRPDLFVAPDVADDLAPDSYARIFFRKGGAVNWLDCSSPEADKAMDEGLRANSEDGVNAAYSRVAEALVKEGCVLPIADIKDAFAFRDNLTGVTQDPATVVTVRYKDLKSK